MILTLYIIIICYLPILDDLIPKTNFGAGIPDIGPYRAGTFVLVLLIMLQQAIKKDVVILNNWLKILVIFYIIYVFSISWSSYSYSPQIIVKIFETAFIPLLLAVIALNLFEHPMNIKSFAIHITIAAIILSLLSIFQMISDALRGAEIIRSAGTFGNPNSLATFLVLTIPYVLYSKEKGFIPVFIGTIASTLVPIGIVCTVSRKGIITMVICFVAYSYLKKNYRTVLIYLIAFMILAIIISGFSVVTRRFEKEAFMGGVTGKFLMVNAGLKMFKTSPIIGLGFNGYYENFGNYYPDPPWPKEDAHNIYITALANYGILGTIPFLFIFLYPLSRSLRALRRSNKWIKKNTHVDLAIVCLSSLVSFMLIGWGAGGLFYEPVNISLFYTTISLFLSSRSDQEMKPER